MPIVKGFDILASGMSAQRTRLNAVSSNLANSETTRTADGGAYQRKVPIFEAIGDNGEEAGVRVASIDNDPMPGPLVYQPGHPHANEEGYVQMPNVNVVEEMVNMISASRAYQNNVEILSTTKSLLEKTLQLGN